LVASRSMKLTRAERALLTRIAANGGKSRAAKLSPARRSAIAANAANARWAREKAKRTA
jgi:hypothetical protein